MQVQCHRAVERMIVIDCGPSTLQPKGNPGVGTLSGADCASRFVRSLKRAIEHRLARPIGEAIRANGGLI